MPEQNPYASYGGTVASTPTPATKPTADNPYAGYGGTIAPVAKPLSDEEARSRTLQNMTAAMSGQPMANPEDQAQFEQGRKAGTIEGGVTIAAGAAGAAGETAAAAGAKYLPQAAKAVGQMVKAHPLAAAALKKLFVMAAGDRLGHWVGHEDWGLITSALLAAGKL